MLAHAVLIFLSGVAIGAAIGSLRARAKLRMYRLFVEARLDALNDSMLRPVSQEPLEPKAAGRPQDPVLPGRMGSNILFGRVSSSSRHAL